MGLEHPIEWEAYDRQPQKHGADWYWAMGIIAVSLVVTALILNNILFAILIVISTFALFLRTLQDPRVLPYSLTTRGISVGKDFTPFTLLESFWVEEYGNEQKLILKQKTITSPFLIVPLVDTDTEEIRQFLAERLPEIEHHEPLSRKVMEYLGF